MKGEHEMGGAHQLGAAAVLTVNVIIWGRLKHKHAAEELGHHHELDERACNAPEHEEAFRSLRLWQIVSVANCGEGDNCEVPCICVREVVATLVLHFLVPNFPVTVILSWVCSRGKQKGLSWVIGAATLLANGSVVATIAMWAISLVATQIVPTSVSQVLEATLLLTSSVLQVLLGE